MTTETAEENETRKKQKQESEKPAGFGILSEGSHVTAVTERAKENKMGNSVGYTVAPGRHYEKVKQAWCRCNMDTRNTRRGWEIKTGS